MPIQDPDEVVGALPQFESPPVQEADDEWTQDQPPPPGEETPRQTSPSRRSPQLPPSPDTTTSLSSTGSSEPEHAEGTITLSDVKDAIGDLAGAAFALSGQALNKIEAKRTARPTTRWIATQDEVVALGHVAESYLVDRLPESVKEEGSDAAHLAVGGLVVVGYVLRNALRQDAVVVGGAPPAPAAPPPTQVARDVGGPTSPPAPAPAPPVLHGQDPAATGVSKPEAPPPDVIPPDL